ncbi:MAG: penicillin-binding protein 2 [Lachnospiraceae bacterium]|nr:penicillin-binding protein 2 [Lachnospiraceae bacterium]
MKTRLLIALGIFLGIFAVLVFRLILLNVNDGARYEQKVLAQQGYTSTAIPYRRGDIVDKNGTVLATTKKVYNLILEPKNILNPINKKSTDITKNALKKYFDMSDEEINKFLKNEESYYEIARKKLEYDVVKPFDDYRKSDEGKLVSGVYFEEEYVRVYPNNELACHILGFTVSGNVGMYGIEQEYNSYLNGSNGREYSYLNDDYSMTNTLEPAVNGYNLVTSIDAKLQSLVQENVDEFMAGEESAKNVSVLIMDPQTCNVLALYNSHTFDPNDAYDLEATRYQFPEMSDDEFKEYMKNASDEETVNALNKLWRNFAISDVYEPGSTYKAFTVAGALEENVINSNDTFLCDGGEQKDIYYVKCWYHAGHGMETIAQSLENSCNDALMQIAAAEGATNFDKYQVRFGFGQMTNLDIPGEPDADSFATVIYHRDRLNEVELATSSFGQGLCVSMIQLGTAFCSLINGGYYYEPSIVQRIQDENGNIIDNKENVLVRRTISEETSATMRDILFKVIDQGTGEQASVEGYEVGGKSGTAEKLPRGNGKYILSFIGFAPIDNPQVMIYVVVDEPGKQSDSLAAKNLFREIAEDVFPYMNIYKLNDNYNLDLTNTTNEVVDSIYGDVIPENDMASGENPYGDSTGGDTTEEPEEGETTEGENTEEPENTEESTEESTE